VDRLHILFLDSWHTGTADGSGTAVGIAGLRKGLEALGHRVEVLRPGGAAAPGLLRRLAFNVRVPGEIGGPARDEALPDLVVGFDIDGFRWSPERRRQTRTAAGVPPAYLVSLKGVAADEARFATSRMEALQLRCLAALERRNARHADGVLVPSRYSVGVVAREYGVPEERIQVVPEAVDMAPFEALRRDPPSPPDTPTILSVARQYPRKDTATLLRAFARVRERIPEVRLRIVGGGPELPRLRALARELALGTSVALEGAILDDEVVRAAYFQAHVFCLPSLQEGFGIAFVEAMAAGLPVVAARAGAAPEVIEDGVTGVLVPPGDPDALAEALIRLLDGEAGEKERSRLGAAGTERARRFAPETVAARFLEAAGESGATRSSGPADHSPASHRPSRVEEA
jgi:glycosyltransferase involved in cell wall biosynthesis